MVKKHLKDIPMTLQEDFIDNRVIPVVGAGFSKNGILPQGMLIPDWNELGGKVADYISNYEYVNAIDALSIFESQFSRVKLVEMLARILNINELKPGETHKSFCDLFFDTICTTNFDFLLEHTLQDSKRPYSIIVSEDRLPINIYEKTKIIKLHGDFNHPERMVITENDYDTFLDKNKILATYVSNLFITKTLLLVGYSFDDTDIRGLWQIINSRLGRLHRPAYVVMVDASPIEISRFERRNIKVINLKGKKSDYSLILNQFFIDLKEMIDEKSPDRMTITNEKAREELKLPIENKRLCFISASYDRLSFLKDIIYPILTTNQITPITLNEAIMQGENWMAKSETLLKESSIVIADASGYNANVMWEMNIAMNLNKKLIVIADKDESQSLPSNLSSFQCLYYSTNNDNDEFIMQLSDKLSELTQTSNISRDDEPTRLLKKNEYNAAVISSFRLLESSLRDYDYSFVKGTIRAQTISLSQILRLLGNSNLPNDLIIKVTDYLSIRNRVVHGSSNADKKTATEIVKTINELVRVIKQEGINI